ncbi:Histone-binding protein RBBP7 [Trichinella pseudospiralis]|uniref:Histone-binding protein RBBP7 n=1 Tax=Trichinella pseudospiralis TaxID=6337 RepID=A0A0V1ITN2_TRIPS|nr:Histone-binding protein RBBP7 [Trichinella pseudospiralis]
MNSFSYEYKFSYQLKHASYSVQSLPSCAFPETTLDSGELVLLGTNKNKNTSTKSKLLLASIPSEDGIAKLREKPQKGKTGFYTCESLSDMIRKRRSVSSKWQIYNMKFMPQNPLQVACRNEQSEILFYDLTKASDDTNLIEKNIWTLKGLGSCGYGLSWNASLPGMLVAAGHDNTICIWSVLHSIVNSDTIHPLSTFRIRRGAINDVCWHPFYDFVFGTVDNSGKLFIWDVRMNGDGEFALQSNTTNSEIMCLSFNPFDQNYLATGDIKGNVAIWDDRNLYRPVKLLQYHSSEVTQVVWSPFYEDLLASAGSDGHIILWKIGVASLPEKLPEIDWNYYKEKTAGFYDVTEFEKQFKSLHIVPMKEPEDLLKKLNEEEKREMTRLDSFIKANESIIQECKKELDQIAKFPPMDHWLPEEYEDYFVYENENSIGYNRYRDHVEQYRELGYRRMRLMTEEEDTYAVRSSCVMLLSHDQFGYQLSRAISNVCMFQVKVIPLD